MSFQHPLQKFDPASRCQASAAFHPSSTLHFHALKTRTNRTMLTVSPSLTSSACSLVPSSQLLCAEPEETCSYCPSETWEILLQWCCALGQLQLVSSAPGMDLKTLWISAPLLRKCQQAKTDNSDGLLQPAKRIWWRWFVQRIMSHR